MNAQPHHRGTYPLTPARKAGTRLVRLTAVLAAITGSLLVTVAGVPAAFARPVPPPGGSYARGAPVPATTIHVITTGGMAGWQITLIALAAALAAATAAVFIDRPGPPAGPPRPPPRDRACAQQPRLAPGGAGPGADQGKAMDSNPSRTGQTGRRSDDPVVTGLVTRAKSGDKQAWDALVERYAPLIWSICRRRRLADADADVAQSVWLKLTDQLGRIRDPAALPGWLATTTRRECDHILRAAPGPHGARYLPDTATVPDHHPQAAGHELVEAERHAALREAFASLPSSCQQLLALLTQDPPVPYAEISARLGIPVGSIGPRRRRCLDKLRRHPAIAALIDADAQTRPEMRGRL